MDLPKLVGSLADSVAYKAHSLLSGINEILGPVPVIPPLEAPDAEFQRVRQLLVTRLGAVACLEASTANDREVDHLRKKIASLEHERALKKALDPAVRAAAADLEPAIAELKKVEAEIADLLVSDDSDASQRECFELRRKAERRVAAAE